MAEIQITAGDLPQPACYTNEQQRLDAYAAALIATLVGGIQWEASDVAPTDLDKYWLKLDGDGNPLQAFKWSVDAGAWLPFKDSETYFGTTTSLGANSYAVTITDYAFSALETCVFFLKFNAANTGAATLTLNSFGAKSIKVAASDLWSGALAADTWYTLVYDGTNFQVLGIKQITASDITGGSNGQVLVSNGTSFTAKTVTFAGTAQSLPSAGSSVTWTHGLGATPNLYQVRLVNDIADAGYSTGDEVDVDASTSGGGTNWCSTWANSTLVGLVFDAWASGPYVSNKSNGASTAITLGSWKVNGYASLL